MSRTPASRIGRTVLVAAYGAAAALGVTALVAFEDPEVAARARFDRAAESARSEVRAAWRSLFAEEWPAPLASPVLRSAELEGRVAPARPLVPELDASPAFEAIWTAATERELAGDVAGARERLAHAGTLSGLSPDQRARRLVREVQWSALLADGAAARRAWRELVATLPPDATIDGLPALVVVDLAVLAWLEPAEARAEVRRLAELWRAGELAWPDEPTRFAVDPDGVFPERPGGQAYALERIAAVDPVARARLDDWLSARDARALEAWLGPFDGPAPGAWSARPSAAAGERWLVVHGEPDGRWRGAFVDERALLAGLERRVEARAALPEGFELAAPASAGEPAAEPVALDPDGPGVALAHVGLDALVADERRRRLVARAALLAGALACAAAGLASARALRRERALAELRTRFVANVSHELRTPLASILLLAENLEAGRGSAASHARYPALIRREAARLRRLVDDVLDFARLERGRPIELAREPLPLEPWLDALADELDERAGAHREGSNGVAVSLERDLRIDVAELDGEALRRAALNLVDNALLHSGADRVCVTARAASGPDGAPARFELLVRDFGRGLTADERERVFEPYERLADGADHRGGTGLGLAIVREIARAHGGDVAARAPADGPGLEVVLDVPCEAPPEDAR